MMFAALATVAGAHAMDLKGAFNALSNLPEISIIQPDYNLPVIADELKDGELAAAYNLNREQIGDVGTAALAILNQVPLSYMVNGGLNGEVGAMVYAHPADSVTSEVLIVAMSGYRGSVVFMYGTMENAAVEAIRQAPLQIEGSFLSLEAKMPDDSTFNIILSKAR